MRELQDRKRLMTQQLSELFAQHEQMAMWTVRSQYRQLLAQHSTVVTFLLLCNLAKCFFAGFKGGKI